MVRSSRARRGLIGLAVAVGCVAPLTPTANAQPPAVAGDGLHSADTAVDANASGTRVTLVTGDVVAVPDDPGQLPKVVHRAPRSDGSIVAFHTVTSDGRTSVIPSDAEALLADGRLDAQLFEVTSLVEQGLTDAVSSIPLIVDHPDGVGMRASAATSASLDAARVTANLPSIGASAAEVAKQDAAAFWSQVTASAKPGNARAAGSLTFEKIWLDARVTVALDESVPQTGAPAAWARGLDGTGTTVAVLDTGVDAGHPDLVGQIRAAQSFVPGEEVRDGHGHGTHVASTIAGTGAASGGLLKGVAPAADLLVGKVLGNGGSGATSWIAAGMEWAVAQGADVVNMSLGGPANDSGGPLDEVADRLSAASDTLFVISAGNDGPGLLTIGSPGTAASALTVAAVDKAGQPAGFSSRGPARPELRLKPDIAAPGVAIEAARAAGTNMGTPTGELYTAANGTSMAAPHVAGAAAILAQQHPEWDGEQLKAALTSSAGRDDEDEYVTGAGQLDVAAATTAAVVARGDADLGRIPVTGAVSGTVTYTNHTAAAVELDLTVVGGTPAVTVTPGELTVPAGGTAQATVTIAGSDAEGPVTARVVATAPDGTTATSVVGGYQLPSMRTVDVRITLPTDFPPENVTGTTLRLARHGGPDVDIFRFPQLRVNTAGPLRYQTELPVGAYSGELLFSYPDADGTPRGVLMPVSLELTSDQTLELDLSAGVPVEVRTPDETELYSTQVSLRRGRLDGHFITTTMIDAPYRTSLAIAPQAGNGPAAGRSITGAVLGPVPVTVSLGGRDELRPQYLTPMLPTPTLATYARLADARGRTVTIVDASTLGSSALGSSTPGSTRPRGAVWAHINYVPGSDLQAQITAARAAGAQAVLISWEYTGAPPLVRDAAGPVLRLAAAEGRHLRARLAAGPVHARYTSHFEPDYVYNLGFYTEDALAARHQVTKRDLWASTERYHHPDPSKSWVYSFVASMPSRTMDPGLGQQFSTGVRAGTTRVVYSGPTSPDVVFDRGLLSLWRSGGGQVRTVDPYSPRVIRTYPTSGKDEISFLEGPMVPGANIVADGVREHLTPAWATWPFGQGVGSCFGCRLGDRFTPLFPVTNADPSIVDSTDTTWETVNAEPSAATTRLFAGTREIPLDESNHANCGYGTYECKPSFLLPAERTDLRLVYDDRPREQYPQLHYPDRVSTEWRFESERPSTAQVDPRNCLATYARDPEGHCAAVPLPYLRYDLGLDVDNALRAGRSHKVTVTAYHDQRVTPAPRFSSLDVWVSFDNGQNWTKERARHDGDGKFTVNVKVPKLDRTTGRISIRAGTTDAAGNSIVQTVIGAAGLK